MRNILAYPTTDKERIETLERIKQDILNQKTIGDLRAEILQECIDTIKSNNTEMQLGADEKAIEKINYLENWYKQQQFRCREDALSHLAMAGLKPGMWSEWSSDPPPLKPYKNGFDLILCAILDVLTQEGNCAWAGDATSCVGQLVRAQLESRKRLLAVLERIAHSPNAEIEDLCQLAEDAILNEKPTE